MNPMTMCYETYEKSKSLLDFFEKIGQKYPWEKASPQEWCEVLTWMHMVSVNDHSVQNSEDMWPFEEFLEKHLPSAVWENEYFVLNLPANMLCGEFCISEVAGLLTDEKFVLAHIVPDTEKKGIHIYFFLSRFYTDSPGEQLLKLAANAPHELRKFFEEACGDMFYEEFFTEVFTVQGLPYLAELKKITDPETYRCILKETVGLHPTLLNAKKGTYKELFESEVVPSEANDDPIFKEVYLAYCRDCC